MRIGLITYGLDRPLTGIGRYTVELIRALGRLEPRPDVTLLCAGKTEGHEGANSFPRVMLSGARLLPGLMTVGQFEIDRITSQLQLDVLHDPTGVTPFYLARKKAGTVVTVHDVFAWSIPGYSSTLDNVIYRKWLPRLLPEIDEVITVSQQSREDVLQYLAPAEERVRIIPYGVTNRFRPLDDGQVTTIVHSKLGIHKPYIVYVGALTQRKNIVRLIEAFARVHAKGCDIMLVIAGPRSWKESPVEETVKALGLEEHILMTGPLTDKELPALYSGAELFAFPSLYEGFGLPVLEAMACGTPVVTSNVSSLPEVVGDAALMVDPYNVDAIADALLAVLQTPELAKSLSRKGLQRATQYTWERTAKETLATYQRVYARNKRN